MSRLYCSDAEAVRLKKEALQTIYNREMRRIGLKLLKLPDTMIGVWLEANVVKKIIEEILPLLYITVGNQKFGLSKVTCFAKQFVRKSLQSILFFLKTCRFTMMRNILQTVQTN